MTEVPEENGARLLLERTKKQLSREERVAFGFIAACGAGALIIGGLFFMSNVKKPFLISYNGPRYVTASEKETEQEKLQRLSDSDEDGVSDYDELRIFETSPYISDSDSDGRLDGIEIAEGDDPNCARGKTCVSSEMIINSAPEGFLNVGTAPVEGNTQVPSVEDTFEALQQLSVSEVREFLIKAGVDAQEIQAMTDEQIMEVYAGALAQAENDVQKKQEEQESLVSEKVQTL